MKGDDRAFLGRGWAFPPRFDANRRAPEMAAAIDDIEQALQILLRTRVGERTLRPRYGLNAPVFMPAPGGPHNELQMRIEAAITEYEPRVKVLDLTVDAEDAVEGRILVSIDYYVPSVNARSNMVFPFYQREGSLIAAADIVGPGRAQP